MSKSYVNSIIDSMQNAVWVVELDPHAPADASAARITHVNPAAAALLHCACSSLVGMTLPDVVPPIAIDGTKWWADVTSGQDVSGIELDLLGPNDVEVPALLAASKFPSRQRKNQHVVCIAQDMTQRRLAEHLVRENDRLVDEIKRLRDVLRGLPPGSVPNTEQPF